MSEPFSSQYESQMFSTIGQDNKTAVITVSLSDSAMSANAMNSLKDMEKNISKQSLIKGVPLLWRGNSIIHR